MDRKKLEELGIDVTVIAQTIAEKPNEVKQILDMFDTYITKTAIFQEYLKAPRNDIQTVGEQLSQFLETVKWRFVEHWCQVEETINVVQHLEEEIQKLGGDINVVRKNYTKRVNENFLKKRSN